MFRIEKMYQLQKELSHLFVTATMRFDSMTFHFSDAPAGKENGEENVPNVQVDITADKEGNMTDVTAAVKHADGRQKTFPFLKDGKTDTELTPTVYLLEGFTAMMENKQSGKWENSYDDFASLGYYLEEQLAGYPSQTKAFAEEQTVAEEDMYWPFEEDDMEPEVG